MSKIYISYTNWSANMCVTGTKKHIFFGGNVLFSHKVTKVCLSESFILAISVGGGGVGGRG